MRGKRAGGILVGCVVASALGLATVGCGGDDRPLSGSVTGQAASTQQPLVRAWGKRFEQQSGAHVVVREGQLAELTAEAADFAVDDGTPASTEGLAEQVAIPVALSQVAVAYNLVTFSQRRIPSGFRIDPHTLASIYKGPTFNWHQKVFLAMNPGVDIPDELFQVCRHSGSWPPTATFTSFLGRSGPNWTHDVGIGAHVTWPKLAAPSVETTDVAGCVKRSPGSIGYVTPAEATQHGLTVAAMQEEGGAFRLPGEPGYPISASLDMLVWRDPCRVGRTEQDAVNTKAWLRYLLGDGQALVRRHGYAPLPAIVRSRSRSTLETLRCDGRRIAVPG